VCLQLDPHAGDLVAHNASLCSNIIRQAAEAGAKLVSLPEASDFIARARDVRRLTCSPENASFLTDIQEAARSGKVFVQVGVHEPSGDPKRVYNTHHLISDKGEIISSYRKLHLFDVVRTRHAALPALSSSRTFREAPKCWKATRQSQASSSNRL
jgi:predicted amidohydrolase